MKEKQNISNFRVKYANDHLLCTFCSLRGLAYGVGNGCKVSLGPFSIDFDLNKCCDRNSALTVAEIRLYNWAKLFAKFCL